MLAGCTDINGGELTIINYHYHYHLCHDAGDAGAQTPEGGASNLLDASRPKPAVSDAASDAASTNTDAGTQP